jgi:hypothetical protein
VTDGVAKGWQPAPARQAGDSLPAK